MSTTRFSSRLCLIKGHRFLKKQYEIFLSLLIPQKRWNILFSSENDRFFQLAHHRAKSSAMFELYWLPVSTLSELRRHVRLLNQWKSVKWSSAWWVQIHADFHWVTISHGRRGRLSFRCSIKKSAVVWENEERLPVKWSSFLSGRFRSTFWPYLCHSCGRCLMYDILYWFQVTGMNNWGRNSNPPPKKMLRLWGMFCLPITVLSTSHTYSRWM